MHFNKISHNLGDFSFQCIDQVQAHNNSEEIERLLITKEEEDENTSILRLLVDNLHNFVRTYGQEADSRAAANIQHIIPKIPPKIALRWSRRKLELQPKEVDLKNLDKWLETELQVQEMALGCASVKENPEKEKPQSNSNQSKWFKKKNDMRNDTHPNSGAKLQCFVCKGEHALTSGETWKRLTVNEGWELAKSWVCAFIASKGGIELNVAR